MKIPKILNLVTTDFWNFDIPNIKEMKNALFDSFIFEFFFSHFLAIFWLSQSI